MKDLKKSGTLNEADTKPLDDFVTLLGEISDYSKALKTYAGDKSQENADKFQDQRKKTWKHLKKVLGIKD